MNRPAISIPPRADEILRLLDELQQEYKSTLLMVTHNAEAASYCNRIVTLHDGQIVEDKRFDCAPASGR